MSSKPNGLSISRKGEKITITWKRKEDYTSQTLQYKLTGSNGGLSKADKKNLKISKLGKWTTASGINGKSKKFVYTLDMDSLYPSTGKKGRVYAISFRIKGKYKKKGKTHETGWTTPKTKKFDTPNKPSLKTTYDENNPTTATFSWETSTKDDDWKPFKNVELVTKLIANCPENIKNEELWSNATGDAKAGTYSQSYNDEDLNHSQSWSRCVRVRARGCAGQKDWVYAKHTWATPQKPEILHYDADYNSTTHKFHIELKWSTPYNAQHPVDKYIIER